MVAGAVWALVCVDVKCDGGGCSWFDLLWPIRSLNKRLLLEDSVREDPDWCASDFNSRGLEAVVWLVTSRTGDIVSGCAIFCSCTSERTVVSRAVVEVSAPSW